MFTDHRQDARDSKFSIFKVIKETPVLHGCLVSISTLMEPLIDNTTYR